MFFCGVRCSARCLVKKEIINNMRVLYKKIASFLFFIIDFFQDFTIGVKALKKTLVSVFVFIIILACGITAAEADSIKLDLYLKDHKFSPEVIKLPPGKKVVITLHNQDSTIEEFESLDLKREKIVLGNSSVKIILAPLEVGEYKFFGEFHEDTAQGKIVVSEDVNDVQSGE